MSLVRLHVVLAKAGVASRRHAEEMILAGRVRVNGTVVSEVGTKIDPDVDRVELDDNEVGAAEPPVTIVLFKPDAVLSTLDDPEGRESVRDLVAAEPYKLRPVGRLDYHTEGVLLMTTDGELANRLLHPKHHVPKTYMVKVGGQPSERALDKLRDGVELEDGLTKPAVVEVTDVERQYTWLEMIVTEGRNRLVRRMCEAVDHRPMRVIRTAFSTVNADDLRPGQYRYLMRDELDALYGTAGLPVPPKRKDAREEEAGNVRLGVARRRKGWIPGEERREGDEPPPARRSRSEGAPGRSDRSDRSDRSPRGRPERDFGREVAELEGEAPPRRGPARGRAVERDFEGEAASLELEEEGVEGANSGEAREGSDRRDRAPRGDRPPMRPRREGFDRAPRGDRGDRPPMRPRREGGEGFDRRERAPRGDRPMRPRREGGESFDRRERAPRGDRPMRPRREGGESFDRRERAPRGEGFERRDRAPRGDRPMRPRREGGEGFERRERAPRGDRPMRPRRESEGFERRERSPRGDRPMRPRRESEGFERRERSPRGDRPMRPRRESEGFDRRERSPRGDRPSRPRRERDDGFDRRERSPRGRSAPRRSSGPRGPQTRSGPRGRGPRGGGRSR